MSIISIQGAPAPSTPLNLRFGVVYSPRVVTPPFVGYEVVQVTPDQWVIRAYDEAGVATETFRGELVTAFKRFALHLRMDM